MSARRKVIITLSVFAVLVLGLLYSPNSTAFAAEGGTISNITFKTAKNAIYVGEKIKTTLTYKNTSRTKPLIVYSSSNSKIATVDVNGIIKGKSNGSTYINVKISNKTCRIAIRVIGIKYINDKELSIFKDDAYTLPEALPAIMLDGIKRDFMVKWDKTEVDTSKIGTYTYKGTVEGYYRRITLVLTVNLRDISDSILKISDLNIKITPATKYLLINEYKLDSNGKPSDKCKAKEISVDKYIENKKIYLRQGPGKYYILIFDYDGKDKYTFLCEIKVRNTDSRDIRFILPSEVVESDDPEIVELADNITEGLQTDREKAIAIHDWVASNIAYDTEAYFANTVQWHSAKEVLQLKKGVCSGYAVLATALNRAVGIKTKIIEGIAIDNLKGETWENTKEKTPNHAWIETFIDGRWIVQDPTWDAGGVDFYTQKFAFKLTHEYFDPAPEDFAKNHQRIEECDY